MSNRIPFLRFVSYSFLVAFACMLLSSLSASKHMRTPATTTPPAPATCYSLSFCRAEIIDSPWAHWRILYRLGSCFTLASEMVFRRTVLPVGLEKGSPFVTRCVLHFGLSKLTGIYFPALWWLPLEVSGAFVFSLEVMSCAHTVASSTICVWVFLWPHSLISVRPILGFCSCSDDLPSAHTDL